MKILEALHGVPDGVYFCVGALAIPSKSQKFYTACEMKLSSVSGAPRDTVEILALSHRVPDESFLCFWGASGPHQNLGTFPCGPR